MVDVQRHERLGPTLGGGGARVVLEGVRRGPALLVRKPRATEAAPPRVGTLPHERDLVSVSVSVSVTVSVTVTVSISVSVSVRVRGRGSVRGRGRGRGRGRSRGRGRVG